MVSYFSLEPFVSKSSKIFDYWCIKFVVDLKRMAHHIDKDKARLEGNVMCCLVEAKPREDNERGADQNCSTFARQHSLSLSKNGDTKSQDYLVTLILSPFFSYPKASTSAMLQSSHLRTIQNYVKSLFHMLFHRSFT